MGDDALIDIEVNNLTPYPVQRLILVLKHERFYRANISQTLY